MDPTAAADGPPLPPPPPDPESTFLQRLQRERDAPDAAAPDAPPADGDEAWLVTYLDTFTLLLTVFVLLIATEGLGRDTADSLRQALAAAASPAPPPPAVLDIEHRIVAASRVAGLGDVVAIRRERGALVIGIAGAVLFDSGEAALRPEGAALVARLAGVVGRADGTIEVQGHTDSRPIATERFPSNWELSSARAGAVVRALVDAGLAPGGLRAVGLAETAPIAGNDTPEGRARNRRVEIRLRIPQGRSPTAETR